MGGTMQLSEFIERNVEDIVSEWEAYARLTIGPAKTMSKLALRDHAAQILRAIAADMKTPQTEAERHIKSQGLALPVASETAATTHGVLRQLVGFDPVQLAAEYRAMRATVLRLWKTQSTTVSANAIDEVVRFNEAVDQALAESIASFSDRVGKSRDTFLAVLGHDLRSPLSAVTSALSILGKPQLESEKRDQILQMAKRSAASMSQMITDLLEYTRTRLGRGIEIVLIDGDLSALCREVLEEVQVARPDRSFIAHLPPRLPTRFDAPRMRQVLSNLLSNAVQYGDPASSIILNLAQEGQDITFAVKNRGKPIPPEALQVIFDPLVQIPAENGDNARLTTSLGLGLYIVQEIVTAHGATISVTSSEAEGTEFKVRLAPNSLA
jgi:signal transduction histidine kinase